MKYLYRDLGEQRQHSRVVVHLHGWAGNVTLLDPVNFDRYRNGVSFRYTGRVHTDTHRPARCKIPEDGHWYLVTDCGGPHHVEVEKIQMRPPKESPTGSEADATLAGARA